jgi:4-hydroxybenzoate polyprenyltransferase
LGYFAPTTTIAAGIGVTETKSKGEPRPRPAPLRAANDEETGSLQARLWRYQAERFPLAQHGVLTVIFAAAACSFAASLTGDAIAWRAVLFGALIALMQFLLLRVADEHKDYETDLAHRPYRPVQRGLVSLRELRFVGAGAAVVMLAVTIATRSLQLLIILAALWGYFALMWAEFFAPKWLTKHPLLYLASHMVLLPLLAWLVAGTQFALSSGNALSLPSLAPMFFVAVLLLGVVLELGRKIRATPDEEKGVETYSALWGQQRARVFWLSAAILSAIATCLAVMLVGGSIFLAVVLSGLGLAQLAFAMVKFDVAAKGSGKRIETASSLLVLSLLAALGIGPHLGAIV